MRGKVTKSFLALAMATSVAFSSFGASLVWAQNDNSISGSSIDELLNKLPENYKNYLEVSSGNKINLDKEVNLKTNDATKVIVEFKTEPTAVQNSLNGGAATFSSRDIMAEHEEFKNSFAKNFRNSEAAVDVEFGYEYTEVFNGIAMTLPANEIEKIAEMDMVKSIWSNSEVQIDLPEEEAPAEGVAPFMHDSLPGIGADRLHDEGIKGKGIKVGVLDTGVDYNHPDLKNAYKGGYDFVNNDDDPMETTYEEWQNSGQPEVNYDGTPYYTSHGTHVAGTILGKGENVGVDITIKGVAPEADLYAYKVLGPYGNGSMDGILAGIEQAIKDDMDVINLSLGNIVNNSLTPEAIAINNCMLYTDTVAVVAAANAGPNAFTVGSPGTAALGITVGANNSEMQIDTIDMKFMDEAYNLKVFAKNWTTKAEDLLDVSLPIEFAGKGYNNDFEGKDFVGKIALIERGELAFVEKIANAKAAGAEYVIVYNNVDGDIDVYLGESNDYIPTLTLDNEQGEKLKEAVLDSEVEGKVVTFENIGQVISEGNTLGDFSSRGPVADNYDIKPEITAPGENILSTVPGYINDRDGHEDYTIAYGRMSGTSMATPHVAGLVALIISEHPEYSPADVKTVLMNTTEELNGDYSVFEVGAGRINGYEAVKSEINIQVNDVTNSKDEQGKTIEIPDVTGDLSFGKALKNIVQSKTLSVFNNGNEDKEFKVETYFTTSNFNPIDNPEGQGVVINVPEKVKVTGGSQASVNFEITVPETAQNGTFEGYVILTNINATTEDYRLPFAINVNEKNIQVETLIDMFSLGEFHPYQGAPMTYVGFEVSDVFDALHVLVKDGETGEYIGYVGSLLTDELPTNMYLEVGPLIHYGYYSPILKDGNENYYIDPTATKLSEDKRYVIEFMGIENSGEVVTAGDDYYIDSVPPVLNMDENSKPGIYEVAYDESQPDEIVWIDGYVYDEYVEYAQSYGLEISQKDNWLGYLEKIGGSSGQGGLTLGEDGKIHIGYPTKQVKDEGVVRLSIYPIDYASSGDYRTGLENYAFIKKGMPYIAVTGENKDLNVGDTVQVTMSGKYLDDFTFGNFDAIFSASELGDIAYKIKSITPSEELQKFLDDNKMTLDIKVDEPDVEFGEAYYPVTCELKGDNIVGINGDMPLLNFEMEVINEVPSAMTHILKVARRTGWFPTENIQFTNSSGESQSIEVLNVSKGVINSTKSSGLGIVVPEGAVDENLDLVKTLEEMGTQVIVTAPDGSKHNGIVDYEYMGYFVLRNVPAMEGTYKVQAETPGHLSATSEARLAFEYNGKIFGSDKQLFQMNQFGGDVNADGVIDVRDALLIARAMGKDVPEVDGICRDINNDGLIGQVDLDYVINNFGIVNSMQEGVDTVLQEFDGMNLEEIVAKAGQLYETKAPEISINVEDGKSYNSQVNLEITSTDYVYATHKVYVNGELFEGNSLYEDGKYEIKVVATDDLGNTAEKVVNIRIKTQGPKIVVEGVEDGKIYDSPVKPVITTEKDTENVITLNGKSYAGEEISAEGKYELKVVSKDVAGNVKEVTISFEIVKKLVNPDPEKPNKPDPEKPAKPDSNLPQTGAIVGSTLLLIGGIVIIGFGVVGVIIMNKKKKEDNEKK